MSLLLRFNCLPIKKLYPSLVAPFSTSLCLLASKTRPTEAEAKKKLRLKIAAEKEKIKLRIKKDRERERKAKLRIKLAADKEKLKLRNKLAAEREKVRKEKQKLRNKLAVERKKEKKKILVGRAEQKKEKFNKLKVLATGLRKRHISSYGLYIKENYAQKALSTSEGCIKVIRILAKEWLGLPDSEKQKYRQKALDIRKQYEDKYNNWVKQLSEDERALLYSKGQKYLTKAQRSLLGVPLSPYRAFSKDAFASAEWSNLESEARKKQFAEIRKEIDKKWNALSESQRQAYKSVQ